MAHNINTTQCIEFTDQLIQSMIIKMIDNPIHTKHITNLNLIHFTIDHNLLHIINVLIY